MLREMNMLPHPDIRRQSKIYACLRVEKGKTRITNDDLQNTSQKLNIERHEP